MDGQLTSQQVPGEAFQPLLGSAQRAGMLPPNGGLPINLDASMVLCSHSDYSSLRFFDGSLAYLGAGPSLQFSSCRRGFGSEQTFMQYALPAGCAAAGCMRIEQPPFLQPGFVACARW